VFGFKRLIYKAFRDDLFTQGAAVAYYTALAFAPMVVLTLTFLGSLHINIQDQLIREARTLMGRETAVVLQTVIDRVEEHPNLGSLAGWLSFGFLLFSASAIFTQLQKSLTLIFRSEPLAPVEQENTFLKIVKLVLFNRLFCLGMVLAFIFIAIVSLVLSAAITRLMNTSLERISTILNEFGSALVFSFLFSLIFRFVPIRRTPWKQCFLGGVSTGVLFTIGKIFIGLYLGQAAIGSAYGAAGSLVVFLAWVYYSALIVFLGAEIAEVFRTQSSA
jgi:membrane protein